MAHVAASDPNTEEHKPFSPDNRRLPIEGVIGCTDEGHQIVELGRDWRVNGAIRTMAFHRDISTPDKLYCALKRKRESCVSKGDLANAQLIETKMTEARWRVIL